MLYIFLPLILFLGFITSYEDTRFGKIRNIHVLIALVYSFIANVLVSIAYNVSFLHNHYYLDFTLNFVIAVIFGFLLWSVGLWSAGDGKLFAAYAALLPLSVYRYGYTTYFPSFALLVNTFLLGLALIMIRSMLRTSSKQKKKNLIGILNPGRITMMTVYMFGFIWPIQLLFSHLGVRSNIILFLVVMFIFIRLLSRIPYFNTSQIALVLVVLRIITNVNNLYPLLGLLRQLIPLALLIQFIRSFGSMGSKKLIKITELRPGMRLADKIIQRGDIFEKEPKDFEIFSRSRDEGQLYPESGDLSIENIKKIKGLHKDGKLCFDEISVHRTIPFAPLIFIGVLLTIILSGNIAVTLFTGFGDI